jgi:hypothetical protein
MQCDAVEHVVDKLGGRLRIVPKYARVLEGPIAAALRHVDELAESIPGPLLCSRPMFAQDPYVNAFFVSPQHIQEVFSESEEVRQLFDDNPLASECWALLCMRMRETEKPGVALVDGDVRHDVMQTSVSFGDHQVISPGADEHLARCALKCCMFSDLLAQIRKQATEAKLRNDDLENRLNLSKARLRRLSQKGDDLDGQQARLVAEIEDLEQQLAGQEPRLRTVNDQLDFVADALSRPAALLRTDRCALRLNRLSVKLACDDGEAGHDLQLSTLHVGPHSPRVAALVRFPREELLPQRDLLHRADLFLPI